MDLASTRATFVSRALAVRSVLWTRSHSLARLELAIRLREGPLRHWDLGFIQALPKSNQTALDIGANIGMYSRVLSKRFNSVVALEPNPHLLPRLRSGALDNVTIIPAAAGNSSGTVTLRVPETAGRLSHGEGSIASYVGEGQTIGELKEFDVPMITIDSLGLKNVGLVKVDVEGAEYEALRGAHSLLEAELPLVVLEAEVRHSGQKVSATFEYLNSLGYSGWFLYQGRVESVATFDADLHQPKSVLKLPDPSYVHMFVFAARDEPWVQDAIQAAGLRLRGAR